MEVWASILDVILLLEVVTNYWPSPENLGWIATLVTASMASSTGIRFHSIYLGMWHFVSIGLLFYDATSAKLSTIVYSVLNLLQKCPTLKYLMHSMWTSTLTGYAAADGFSWSLHREHNPCLCKYLSIFCHFMSFSQDGFIERLRYITVYMPSNGRKENNQLIVSSHHLDIEAGRALCIPVFPNLQVHQRETCHCLGRYHHHFTDNEEV